MNATMRVLILTPTAFPKLTGNAVSTERWRRSMRQKGHDVRVVETKHLDPRDLADVLDRFAPHVVHAHHISRAGALMLDTPVLLKFGRLPFVVSPGGTDINENAVNGAGIKIVGETCRRARFIIAQSPEIADQVLKLFPGVGERIAIVHKSFFWFGNDPFDLRSVSECRPGDVLFFMPASIRPVKGNLDCLQALEKAHALSPNIRAVFAGPPLDATYAARFAEEVGRRASFVKWIHRIPPQCMRAAYESADVILNHSSSEGLSNSLLEAMAAGRPVLASDIPGNQWLVADQNGIGPCGSLVALGDQPFFVEMVLKLVRDSEFRGFLAANGRLRAASSPQPSDEAEALLQIYRAAVCGLSGAGA